MLRSIKQHTPADNAPQAGILPAIDTLSLKVSRHDNHNLEIKAEFRGSQTRVLNKLDLYLFMPQSMQLSSYSKSTLAQDIQSRVRFSKTQRIDPEERKLLEQKIDKLQELVESSCADGIHVAIEQEIFQQTRRPRPEFGVNFRRVSLRDRYRQGLFSIMMHRVQVSAA